MDGNMGKIFTQAELDVAIFKMKHGRAVGPDTIPAEAFKYGGIILRGVLLDICNICLEIGYIPKAWKDILRLGCYIKKRTPQYWITIGGFR